MLFYMILTGEFKEIKETNPSLQIYGFKRNNVIGSDRKIEWCHIYDHSKTAPDASRIVTMINFHYGDLIIVDDLGGLYWVKPNLKSAIGNASKIVTDLIEPHIALDTGILLAQQKTSKSLIAIDLKTLPFQFTKLLSAPQHTIDLGPALNMDIPVLQIVLGAKPHEFVVANKTGLTSIQFFPVFNIADVTSQTRVPEFAQLDSVDLPVDPDTGILYYQFGKSVCCADTDNLDRVQLPRRIREINEMITWRNTVGNSNLPSEASSGAHRHGFLSHPSAVPALPPEAQQSAPAYPPTSGSGLNGDGPPI